MKGKKFQSFFLIYLGLVSTYCFPKDYVIQLDHSQIFFKVNYLKFGHVQGQFKDFKGNARLSHEGVSALDFTINASSIDTGHTQRDGHLKAQDFFYTKKYPEIKFQSVRVVKKREQKWVIEGDLIIKEIRKKQVFHLMVGDEVEDSWGYPSRFVELNGVILRSDYGLNWNKTLKGDSFLISDTVEIKGIIQLQQADNLTPPSKHMIPDTPSIRLREKSHRGEMSEKPNLVAEKKSEMATELFVAKKSPDFKEQMNSLPPKRPVNQDPWFWVLGLMGFLSSIILGLYGKKIIMDYFPEYEEDALKGHLSDFITIGFSLLYATAYWLVGWGD